MHRNRLVVILVVISLGNVCATMINNNTNADYADTHFVHSDSADAEFKKSNDSRDTVFVSTVSAYDVFIGAILECDQYKNDTRQFDTCTETHARYTTSMTVFIGQLLDNPATAMVQAATEIIPMFIHFGLGKTIDLSVKVVTSMAKHSEKIIPLVLDIAVEDFGVENPHAAWAYASRVYETGCIFINQLFTLESTTYYSTKK